MENPVFTMAFNIDTIKDTLHKRAKEIDRRLTDEQKKRYLNQYRDEPETKEKTEMSEQLIEKAKKKGYFKDKEKGESESELREMLSELISMREGVTENAQRYLDLQKKTGKGIENVTREEIRELGPLYIQFLEYQKVLDDFQRSFTKFFGFSINE